MKKIFSITALLIFSAGFSQDDYKIVLKSEKYTINKAIFTAPETIFALSESTIFVKPLGVTKLIRKAVKVKDTSVYFCEFNGKQIEVITVITMENFKVTVRGENLKYVIEGAIPKLNKELSKSTAYSMP